MGESALLLVRMLASLVVVGVLLWVLAKVAGSRGLSSLGRGPIDIQARRALSRSASLVLVRVGERQLLLGVGEHGVQVLAEGDELADGLENDAVNLTDRNDPVGRWQGFPELVESLRRRTVRRGAG